MNAILLIRERILRITLRILLLPLMLLWLNPSASAQKQNLLSGYVRDAAISEDLIGATIYVPQLELDSTTNACGFY
ncbi:MAG: hypothetical protein ACNS62_00465 [Candidatus Cyclobacteriaceae bacterium M3_2C_046]